MLKEVLVWLRPRAGGIYLDGTVGAGGHSQAILEASGPDGRLIGLDRDAAAVEAARERLAPFGGRVVLMQAHYRETFNFTLDGLNGARTALARIEECLTKARELFENSTTHWLNTEG